MLVSTALSFFLLLISSSVVSAVPSPNGFTQCDMSNALLPVPDGQIAIVRPSAPPISIGLGLGTQNYTCSPTTLTYTSVGAVAEILDISCQYAAPQLFSLIQGAIYTSWLDAPPSTTPSAIFGSHNIPLFNLGPHYFIPNPITGVGISPVWDYSQSTGGFMLAAKSGNIPAPDPNDVDWLSLKSVQGNLAAQMFRVETKGGQPPASCEPGSAPITVKYLAQYWMYGS